MELSEVCKPEYTEIQDLIFPYLNDSRYVVNRLYGMCKAGNQMKLRRTAYAITNAINNCEKEINKCLEEM